MTVSEKGVIVGVETEIDHWATREMFDAMGISTGRGTTTVALTLKTDLYDFVGEFKVVDIVAKPCKRYWKPKQKGVQRQT